MKILILVIMLLTGCSAEQSTEQQYKDIIVEETKAPNEETPETEVLDVDVYQKYMEYVDFKDGYEVADFLYTQGDEYQYATYFVSQKDDFYFNIVVIKENEVEKVILSEKSEYASIMPTLENLIVEIDINGDNLNDVLVLQGGFGTQGSQCYKCFLANDFLELEEFEWLSNPVIDLTTGEILTSSRGNASTYIYEKSKIINDELIFTNKITYSVNLDGQQVITEEYYEDGEWKLLAEYYLDDVSNFPNIDTANIWTENFGINTDRWENFKQTTKIQ
ncbi:MAG: hypothetical protein R3Y12_08210 [Clostridia bacterium]